MLRSLYSGITGLEVSGMKMSVVGDNLANSQTIGFKKGIPIFQDLLAQSISSFSSSGNQIGLGARTAAVWQDFSQGALKNSNRALDMSINGQGFFILKNRASKDTGGAPIATSQYYTRAGAFDLDKNGYIINATGYILQGYTVDPITGAIQTGPTDLQVDATRTDPLATSSISLAINLDPTTSAHTPFTYYMDSEMVASQGTVVHDHYYYLNGANLATSGTAIYNPTGGADPDVYVTFSMNNVLISATVTDGMTLASFATYLSGLCSDASVSAYVTVEASGGQQYLRLRPTNANWTITGMSDPTLMDLDLATPVQNTEPANLTVGIASGATVSTVSISVSFGETILSVADDLNSALAALGHSATATVYSGASGAYIRVAPNNASWTVNNASDTMTTYTDANGVMNATTTTTTGSQTFNASDPSTYDYSTTTYVYDQQGGKHATNMYFVKVDENTWNYYALSPDSVSPHAYTATPTQPTGRLIFDEDGNLAHNQQPPGNNLPSGTYPTVTFTYVDDETLQPVDLTTRINFTPRGTYGNTTQNGNSFVNYFTGQDGYGPGSLESIEIDNDGMIVGKYSNGESLYVGRVALATFQNTQGLHREGGTVWTETRDSGAPSLNPAEEGGSGSIYGYSLEDANVDMAEEFVDMIVAQRAWQANAKTISTSDQMLADLMNIKR